MTYFSRFVALSLLAMLLAVVPLSFAQDGASGIEISSPVEVTELFGDVSVEGTAAVPGMAYYYLEVHPLTRAIAYGMNLI